MGEYGLFRTPWPNSQKEFQTEMIFERNGAGEQMSVVEHHGGKRDVEVGKKWRAQCNGHMGAQWGESGKRESGGDVGEQISG